MDAALTAAEAVRLAAIDSNRALALADEAYAAVESVERASVIHSSAKSPRPRAEMVAL